MLYIISGASRSGKTLIAKRLSKEKEIPYLSLDWIMMGFTNGIPEFGVHDKLFPDDIARRLWPFFKSMFESMLYVETDCVIEGEALLPELIIELLEKYPNSIKICFLGFTEVNVQTKMKEIKEFSPLKNDWLLAESDDYIIDHIENMISHSNMVKKSCHATNLRYVDVSSDFLMSTEKILTFLR